MSGNIGADLARGFVCPGLSCGVSAERPVPIIVVPSAPATLFLLLLWWSMGPCHAGRCFSARSLGEVTVAGPDK